MVHAMPRQSARLITGERATTEGTWSEFRVAYGYDKPLDVQYFKYVGGILQEISDIYKNSAGLWRKKAGNTLPNTLYYLAAHLPLWQS